MESQCGICKAIVDGKPDSWEYVVFIVADDYDFESEATASEGGDSRWMEYHCCDACMAKIRKHQIFVDATINFRLSDVEKECGQVDINWTF